MTASNKKLGRCALTGTEGKFVKSHLIPRALTKPRLGGQRFPQIDSAGQATKRMDSWYDNQLVVREGEDILAELDDHGIAELKRLKLIWQSWGPMAAITGPVLRDEKCTVTNGTGFRLVEFSQPRKFQRFLLSLLWRASATSLNEFGEVSLPASQERRLRQVVRGERTPELEFYPAILIQLSTIGLSHNMAPIVETKMGVQLGRYRTRDAQIIRFYMDGLIVHFHSVPHREVLDGLTPQIVGAAESTAITLMPFESSWQRRNLAALVGSALTLHPDRLRSAGGF